MQKAVTSKKQGVTAFLLPKDKPRSYKDVFFNISIVLQLFYKLKLIVLLPQRICATNAVNNAIFIIIVLPFLS